MNQINNYPIKIKIGSGVLKINIKKSRLPQGTCKNCGCLINWVKLFNGRSLQLNHIKNNEYILHSLTCKTVLDYKEKMRKRKFKKIHNKIII